MLTQRDLTRLTGPVLSDGTTLRDLIDLDKREVSLRVLNDPELHRWEMRKVFAKSWIGIAHVSEIPNAGDFVLRYIGQDQVIVTRDEEGEVNILLNVCAHRGMEICWADEGNSSTFKCPYHGWVFDGSGSLLGAPFEKEMYGDWDKSQYGLRKARVGIRHGVIFGNFDANALPLEDWMGEFAFYFDQIYEGTEDYEVLAPPARWVAKSNWKTIADQNAGDLYHIAGAHRAVVELGFMPNIDSQIDVVKVGFPGQGHNVFGLNPMTTTEQGGSIVEETGAKYGFEGRGFIHFCFPITTGGGQRMPLPDGSTVGTVQINNYQPKSHNTFEVWSLSLISKGAPEEMRTMFRRMTSMTVSLLQDDADAVASMQHAATGVVAQERTMKYNAVLGENKPKDWPGPGTVYAGYSKDDTNWDFWQRWFEMLAAEA
jgi:phenylpropionate dioxygenase-like ring-hydroxylating dioxygenase large terminal subunit